MAEVNSTIMGMAIKRIEREEDVVNHPNHYAPNGVDSFMHMKDQMGAVAFDGFLQGNTMKYVQRYAFKGKPSEDLCKAAFYLFHLAFDTAAEANRKKLYDRLAATLQHAADHFQIDRGISEGLMQ